MVAAAAGAGAEGARGTEAERRTGDSVGGWRSLREWSSGSAGAILICDRAPESGISKERIEETKSALRELGLSPDDLKGEK